MGGVEEVQTVHKGFSFLHRVRDVKNAREIVKTAMTMAIARLGRVNRVANTLAREANTLAQCNRHKPTTGIVVPDNTTLKLSMAA